MLLDLPPEVLLLIISSLTISEIHTFQLVARLTNDIIHAHSSSVYRAIAVLHGMAPEELSFEEIMSKRRRRIDWLRGASTWKEYVQRHFTLERNWREGLFVNKPSPFYSHGPHRLQVDDLEGTIITTRTRTGVVVQSFPDYETLWENVIVTAYAHCEFDRGFLIWGRFRGGIEVWRRKTDTEDDPLPARSPDSIQIASNDFITAQTPTLDGSPQRGCYEPFAVLTPPRSTSASRFVYPHLVLATPDNTHAYVYDVPNAKLVKTIPLTGQEANAVFYVEHSQIHVFVCTGMAIDAYRKSDCKHVFTLPHDNKPATHEYQTTDLMEGIDGRHALGLIPRSPAARTAVYQFIAIHVSPCGQKFVGMSSFGQLVIVTGFEEGQDLETSSIDLDDDLVYLAFDGNRIAVAGEEGIYVITLNPDQNFSLPANMIHEYIKKATVRLYPQSHVQMPSTSCLQITDSAVWFVAGKGGHGTPRCVTCIDFSNSSVQT